MHFLKRGEVEIRKAELLQPNKSLGSCITLRHLPQHLLGSFPQWPPRDGASPEPQQPKSFPSKAKPLIPSSTAWISLQPLRLSLPGAVQHKDRAPCASYLCMSLYLYIHMQFYILIQFYVSFMGLYLHIHPFLRHCPSATG